MQTNTSVSYPRRVNRGDFLSIIEPATIQILQDRSGVMHRTFDTIALREDEKRYSIVPLGSSQARRVRSWLEKLKADAAVRGSKSPHLTVCPRHVFHVATVGSDEAKLLTLGTGPSDTIIGALGSTRTFHVHRHKQGCIWQYRIKPLTDVPSGAVPAVALGDAIEFPSDEQLHQRLRAHVGEAVWKMRPMAAGTVEPGRAPMLKVVTLDF